MTETRKAVSAFLRELLYLAIKILGIVLVFFLVFTFIYGVGRVTDESMSPAMREGDLVIFYRLDQAYSAGDVLLLEYEGKRQIRRVVAVAGDTVDITEEGLFINGALQQEPHIFESTARYENDLELPLTVGEGQVFVLADARENATDSRVYGIVDTHDTLGKVIALFRRRNL